MKKALLSLLLAVAIMPLAFAQDNTQRTIITSNSAACETFTWSANGQTYTNDTVVYYINATDDTLYVLNLTINTPYQSTQAITGTRCSYDWHGETYTASGIYQDTLFAATGSGECDSVFQLILSLPDTETDIQNINTCGYYVWQGDTISESGTYTDTTITLDGACTHIDRINLTIINTINSTADVEHCGNYNWFDTVLTTSGTYTHLYQDTVNNCDTLYSLNLTIVVDSAATIVDSACASKNWRGNTYTESGLYYVLDTNTANNCVTYHAIDLKIKTPRTPESDHVLEGCNSIIFTISSITGNTTKRFSESTDFDTILVDRRISRCYDSTIHLHITIHKSARDTVHVAACDQYTWELNNATYVSTPTSYPSYAFATDTFGCDSLRYLDLTIQKSPVITAINGEWNLQQGDTAKLYPTCTNGATYKWTYGNRTSNVDTLIIPDVQGNIDVALEATLNYPASNIACHDTSWITIVTFVGINNAENANISLYPNPTVGQLHIESAENISHVAIFNTLGQQILANTNLGTSTVMDLTNLPKGNYTMRLTLQNGETIIRKFIITK